MSDVSCRAFSFFRLAEAKGLVRIDDLLRGLDVRRSVLESPERRVSWDVWVTLCDRFAAGIADEAALAATADCSINETFAGRVLRLAAILPDSRQAYLLGLRYVAPGLYRSLRFEVDESHADHLVVSISVQPGYRGCRSFLVMSEGHLARVPRYLGLPDARVERVLLNDRRGAWRVYPPAGARHRSRLARVVAALRSPSTVTDELADQERQLAATLDGLRRASQSFQSVLDALPMLVAVHREGRIVYANPALRALVGRSEDELSGVELSDLVVAEDRAALAELDATDGPDGGLVLRFVGRSGRAVPVASSCAAGIEFGGGAVRALIGRDLSAERRARHELERSEATVRALLEALPDLVFRVDRSGVLVDVQAGAPLREAGLLEGHIGAPLDDALSALGMGTSDVERLRGAVDEALVDRAPREEELSVTSRVGRPRVLVAAVLPLDGLDEVLLVVRDDSERRETARRLAIAERMASLATLSGGVAHEINNPLTYLMTDLSLVREAVKSDSMDRAEVLELLSEIEEGAIRIRNIVAQMRELTGMASSPSDEVELGVLVRRALDDLASKGRLRWGVVEALHPVARLRGDAVQLEQVVSHLLANAMEATEQRPAPSIRVALFEDGDDVVLEVSDDGPGIPSGSLGKVFDPFFTTRLDRRGAGLGLAIVERVVSSHGGTVRVESEEGAGTTVRVRLPKPRPEGLTRPPSSTLRVTAGNVTSRRPPQRRGGR